MPQIAIHTDGRVITIRHLDATGPNAGTARETLQTTNPAFAIAAVRNWIHRNHTRPAPPDSLAAAPPPRSYLNSRADADALAAYPRDLDRPSKAALPGMRPDPGDAP